MIPTSGITGFIFRFQLPDTARCSNQFDGHFSAVRTGTFRCFDPGPSSVSDSRCEPLLGSYIGVLRLKAMSSARRSRLRPHILAKQPHLRQLLFLQSNHMVSTRCRPSSEVVTESSHETGNHETGRTAIKLFTPPSQCRSAALHSRDVGLAGARGVSFGLRPKCQKGPRWFDGMP